MRRSGCSAPRTAGRTSRRPSCSGGSAMTVAPEGCVANPSQGSRWRKPAFRRDAQRGEPVVPARVNAVKGTLVAAAAPDPLKGACRPRHGVSIRLTRSEEVLRRDQVERAVQTGAPATADGVKPGGRRWTTTIRCPGLTNGRQEICRLLFSGALRASGRVALAVARQGSLRPVRARMRAYGSSADRWAIPEGSPWLSVRVRWTCG